MDSPSRALTLASPSPTSPLHCLSPRRRRGRSRYSSNSPEFEFWNLGRNPSPTTLHSADELFSDGFLLPLHLLPDYHQQRSVPDPGPGPDPESGPNPDNEPESASSASITSSAGNPILTASKRWKEIFKRGEKKTESNSNSDEISEKLTDKRREKKNGNGNSNNSAELNINIWPFSRSRSAGNNTSRARTAASTGRKVSSAPCSRSNSSGSRRSWPSSPGRAGVHLGRASPVWQVRKTRLISDEGRRGKAAGKGRVLNLNVPVCIGYRQQLSCRSDENGAVGGGVSGGGEARSSGTSGNLFSLRGLFSKKSVLTA